MISIKISTVNGDEVTTESRCVSVNDMSRGVEIPMTDNIASITITNVKENQKPGAVETKPEKVPDGNTATVPAGTK